MIKSYETGKASSRTNWWQASLRGLETPVGVRVEERRLGVHHFRVDPDAEFQRPVRPCDRQRRRPGDHAPEAIQEAVRPASSLVRGSFSPNQPSSMTNGFAPKSTMLSSSKPKYTPPQPLSGTDRRRSCHGLRMVSVVQPMSAQQRPRAADGRVHGVALGRHERRAGRQPPRTAARRAGRAHSTVRVLLDLGAEGTRVEQGKEAQTARWASVILGARKGLLNCDEYPVVLPKLFETGRLIQ